MDDTNATNPRLLARQFRDTAIRLAESNYKKDLIAAAQARDAAISATVEAKSEAIKQAQITLIYPKKRLTEARDQVEARFRKQELDKTRDIQERMLIKAEEDRIKALKQAHEMGKRLAAEAAERRRRAIQDAYNDEKKMKLEAGQALLAGKAASQAKIEEGYKANQKSAKEAAEAKERQDKAAVAERNVHQTLEKKQEPQVKEAAKIREAVAHAKIVDDRKTRQEMAKEAAEAKKREQKAAIAETESRKTLERKLKLEAEESAKISFAAARAKIADDRKATQEAEKEAAKAKKREPKANVSGSSSRQTIEYIGVKANNAETEPINITRTPEPQDAAAKINNIEKPLKKSTAQSVQSSKQKSSVNRTGNIKLTIVQKDADMLGFENGLRNIPGIRLIMIGGSYGGGIQIMVSAQNSVALSAILKQMAMVEEVTDRSDDILIRLKSAAKVNSAI